MYSFEPAAEQQIFQEAVRRFVLRHVREAARAADEAAEWPHALREAGWSLGLLLSSLPEQYGGAGARSAVTGVLAAEELACGDLAAALLVLAPGLAAVPLLLAGSAAQKERYLPRFARANYPCATAALIEPRYDFDAGNLQTAARHDGTHWILDGVKCLVPLAAEAELLMIYAREGGRTQGFLVEAGAPGLEIGSREQNMGVRALPTYSIALSGCRALDRLGGPEGHDFDPVLNASRVALGGLAVGVARAAYEYALAYAKERQAFGEAIGQRQAIAFLLAEMATEIEAARLLVWEAAWRIDQGLDATREAYLARHNASDIALQCADRAVQILGGHGYVRDHPVEMWLRNARGFAVFEGMAIL